MIIIGSDHAGYDLKLKTEKFLKEKQYEFIDVSLENKNTQDDYPDIAKKICDEVLKNDDNIGIAICGTGIGISIACNKIKNIRAALIIDKETAKLAKKHNNANVICFGEKTLKNVEDIQYFLSEKFEGGRHQRRIDEIKKMEEI